MNIITNPSRALNLRICGGKEFSLDQVRNVPTPEATTKEFKIGERVVWQPIGHGLLIDRFKEQAEAANLTIEQEYLTLARDGQRFFGLFHVSGIGRANSDKIGTVIGLRNSHDKSFPAAICAGQAPFVCTNLVFSNEITLGRKHTLHILRDLPQLIARAMGQLGSHWANQERRAEVYHDYSLDNAEAHHLIIEAFRNGAIPKTKIADVAAQWHTPEHDEFSERSGWSLYNAFTNVLRGNINELNSRSDALHGTLDLAFGLNSQVVEAEVVAD